MGERRQISQLDQYRFWKNTGSQSPRASESELIHLRNQLEDAAGIQCNFLPETLFGNEHFNMGAILEPATNMPGGDFFDVISSPPEILLLVADVSDKGPASALYMAVFHAFLHNIIKNMSPRNGLSPADILRLAHQDLIDIYNGDNMFLTAALAKVNTATGGIEIARAGHEYPVMYDGNGKIVDVPHGFSQPLGISTELIPHPAIQTIKTVIPAGGGILLYSDGVTTQPNPRGEMFDENRLRQTIEKPWSDAQGWCNTILNLVEKFRGAEPQYDDITLLAYVRN